MTDVRLPLAMQRRLARAGPVYKLPSAWKGTKAAASATQVIFTAPRPRMTVAHVETRKRRNARVPRPMRVLFPTRAHPHTANATQPPSGELVLQHACGA